MHDLLKTFLDLGFNPLSSVLLVALVLLMRHMIAEKAKTEVASEARHQETRELVVQMNKHVEDCNKDRETLKIGVARLEGELNRLKQCKRANCPFK